MMLTSAVNLSKLVQEEEVVSWGNIKSVEKYVNTLKGAVEKLASENNLLTAYHLQILEKVHPFHLIKKQFIFFNLNRLRTWKVRIC